MPSADEYAQRLQAILAGRNEFTLKRLEDAPLALRRVNQLQKEIRLLKKEIGLTIKSLRSQYTAQRVEASKESFGKNVVRGLVGRRFVSRFDAAAKDSIRQAQHQQIGPYEELSRRIDTVLLDFDAFKIRIEQWVSENSE